MSSLKIVAVSDTHGYHKDLDVPDGDCFIHCGDATNYGRPREFEDLAAWMNKLPHQHKIFIPGNHDKQIILNPDLLKIFDGTDIIVGINQIVPIGKKKIYACAAMWGYGTVLDSSKSCDVLATHAPPFGILDDILRPGARKNESLGENHILNYIEKNPPYVSIFGHVHEWGGQLYHSDTTRFYNLAVCNEDNQPVRSCRVIDV